MDDFEKYGAGTGCFLVFLIVIGFMAPPVWVLAVLVAILVIGNK